MISNNNLTDANGNLATSTLVSGHQAVDVNVVQTTGGSSGGNVDNSTFTVSTTTFQPDGGVFNDGLTDLASGNQAMVRITAKRSQHVNLRSVAGVELGTAASPLFAQINAGAAAIGSVTVSNFPATQPVSGTVSLGAGAAAIGSVTVSNFPATQPISGSVSVSNFPTSQVANLTYNSTAPTITSGNTSSLQGDVNGNLKVVLSGTSTVSVSNFPATQPVSGTVSLGAGAAAIGSVSVSNFPATQPVSGTVSISGSVAVTGAFFQATQPVSIAATVATTNAQDISSTATPVAVTVTAATNTALVSANAANKYVTLYNKGLNPINISIGGTASATLFTTVLNPGGTLERKGYQGAINGYSILGCTMLVTVES